MDVDPEIYKRQAEAPINLDPNCQEVREQRERMWYVARRHTLADAFPSRAKWHKDRPNSFGFFLDHIRPKA
ncbi:MULTISPECIES: hypothetical protein [Bradyrhizobium]|jgi:hypothetical protein|uniref:hypothetical protein n=1 Tax=Bradyrhizobium TaxID=374 RepID=UPI00293E43D5|nr:hypothetical protein [Bradyrhizobium sp. NDS-1]WOH73515.1 hypothetical protein RX330_35540 [Bradyrhizobium sp. NDS-1]